MEHGLNLNLDFDLDIDLYCLNFDLLSTLGSEFLADLAIKFTALVRLAGKQLEPGVNAYA